MATGRRPHPDRQTDTEYTLGTNTTYDGGKGGGGRVYSLHLEQMCQVKSKVIPVVTGASKAVTPKLRKLVLITPARVLLHL